MNWLTTREACEYLKICRATLMRLKNEGMVKSYALYRGRKKARPILRWREEDLDTVLLGLKGPRVRSKNRCETDTLRIESQ